MSSESFCAQCGATTYADALDGLCVACVGRGILRVEFSPADLSGTKSGSALASLNEAGQSAQLDPQPGSRIGPYRLIRSIGEGGFGVVYLAEQLEPVKRQVALKVVKLGMDTRQVVARFEAERQALALMDHPGIAKVFDAGATQTGRPYFVMEFVQGSPITQYADRQQLKIPQRLELFIRVCDAVQHAHQKGVIHRDLKPSNILVTVPDGPPLPKVIDFGLAKATQVELTDKTLITHFRQFVGTPAYMSPEQVEMGAVDVDTRSDIYALGVLLYELLTGRTPLDTQELLRGGMDEVSRRIREREPPRPSARLHSLSPENLASVAQDRRATPEKICRLVRGDLDWIVMKALEKNRTRRYETANALALDIRRHVSSEPVRARPPRALYQFQKLIQRNKLAVGSAVAVGLSLIVGLSVTTGALVHERQTRRLASAKAEESRQRLVRLNVLSGTKLVEEGDAHGALLWFAEALRLDGGQPAREDAHRRRIAAVLRHTPALASLSFHDGFVSRAEFSADGRRLVSASDDGTARLWDATTGRPMTAPLRHPAGLVLAAFTAQDERVVTACWDGRLRVWDLRTGQLAGEPRNFVPEQRSVAVSPDGRWLVARVAEGAQLFDGATGEPAGAVLADSSAVRNVHFSPDGQRAIGVDTNDLVRFWEVPSGRPVAPRIQLPARAGLISFSPQRQQLAVVFGAAGQDVALWNVVTGARSISLPRPGGDLYDCRFSPDGRWLATASWDGEGRMFETTGGFPAGDAMRHGRGVARTVFSADSRWVATASWDGTARLWIAGTGRPASPSLHHAGYVASAAFSADSARLVTAGQDQTVRVWDLRTNSAARLELRHEGPVVRARFSPDGRWILTCSVDQRAIVWQRRTGQPLLSLLHGAPLVEAKFSADGRRIATAGQDGTARLWDATRGEEAMPLVRHPHRLRAMDVSADGARLVTAGDDGTARVWDTSSGEPVASPLSHRARVTQVAFSPDARFLVTASFDHTAQLWDARTGQRVGRSLPHVCEVAYVAFSPDGTRVVTAASDVTQLARAAQVWRIGTSEPLGPPLAHTDGVLFAAFSPDGRFIVTTSEDTSAVVWDAHSGAARTRPLRHGSYALQAAFSPDSRLLLTVSMDNTARVWDVEDSEPVTPPLPHGAAVVFGAWSPDGEEVITACYDGTARVWEVAPATASLAELQRQAELLSGHRLEPAIGPVPLTAEELKARWHPLQRRQARSQKMSNEQ